MHLNKPEILLIGAGGHARACIDVIEGQDKFQIAGLVGSVKELNSRCLGYKVIATDDELPRLVREFEYAFVAIGQIRSSIGRAELYLKAVELGFKLPVIVSPKAYVSRHAEIGKGSIVLHGATVNASARIGNNCIINSGAIVEHDVVVENHCHISTGAVLNGGVRVCDNCFVGSNSVVKEGIELGKGSIVGMGLCVRQRVAPDTCFVGVR